MTHSQYIIERKLSLVDLGETLGNISDACRRLGVSRQHYYDIKTTLEEEGLQGLLEKSRRMPRTGNRVATCIEEALLDYALNFPTHGQVRAANELSKKGFQISAGGVRSVWLRHHLETKAMRLSRLEKWAAEHNGVLSESQVQALEDAKEEKEACGTVESPHPGFLLAQDTCYIGYIKGVGKIYQQTAIDTHANVGFAKLYTEKNSLAAADMLNTKVLPFYDEQQISVLRVLTDRGTEYCGRVETNYYELFLHLNDIEHTKTKPRTPRTNGSVERLNQITLDEFYKVAFRRKFYKTLEDIQTDLDEFMMFYNNERTNQGRYCRGRTPMETLKDGLALYQQYVFEGKVAEEKAA